ncbi:isochorismatase family protein [Sphingomonas sp. IC-56]|uniref:isochorismatase family protein n=1 Tax=Sphingomonas sp. IC-56 TaxID=2898529 RepID=UPI002ED95A26
MTDTAFQPRSTDALIVIDPQIDFCPGGALAVAGGDEVMPGINMLAPAFPIVAVTQDWHPAGHHSFASSHPDFEPFDTIAMPYGDQVLWPDHCIQGSAGATFHPAIAPTLDRATLIVRKGYNPAVDSYSAFLRTTRSPGPVWPAFCATRASRAACSWGWPMTSASPGQHSTLGAKGSKRWC